MGPIVVAANGVLAPLERNRYFYGKLMDVGQFEKEQRYFLKQSRLLNRLTFGSGVVAGLNVTADAATRMVTIEAGVAIDPAGRVIVVPAPVQLNPAQLTDDQGNPAGDPISGGTVLLCLTYAERCTDPVAVLVQHCDTPGDCAPSTVREDFRVLVRLDQQAPPAPPGCLFDPFPANASDLHDALCDRIHSAFPEVPAELCVPLARVGVADLSVDACAGTPLVYGNSTLYGLIVCLAEHVAGVSSARILRYVSGDGQSSPPGEKLAAPLVVEVTDGAANPVSGVAVQFQGDGTASPDTINTDAQGRAETAWTPAKEPPEQKITASAAGSIFSVTFRATAK